MIDFTTPPNRPLVAASILSADFGRMTEECRDVLAKGADLLHVDVMDGHFVSNLTMGQDMIRALRKHLPDVYLDVHLMVERPSDYLESFAAAGANCFSFHLEVCTPTIDGGEDAESLIEKIRVLGMHAGMVVNPPTAPDGLLSYLPMLDLVLVMSVYPGRSGQQFISDVLDKTRWLKQRIGAATRLEMDGGLNPGTAGAAVDAGVDVMVTASALFGAEDRAAVVRRLHEAGTERGAKSE